IHTQIAASWSTSPARFNRLVGALKGVPPKLAGRKGKDRLAVLILTLSQGLKHPLAKTEIIELFDAVAEAENPKQRRDPDLPDDPETFARQLRRRSELFRLVFGRTKDDSEMSGLPAGAPASLPL